MKFLLSAWLIVALQGCAFLAPNELPRPDQPAWISKFLREFDGFEMVEEAEKQFIFREKNAPFRIAFADRECQTHLNRFSNKTDVLDKLFAGVSDRQTLKSTQKVLEDFNLLEQVLAADNAFVLTRVYRPKKASSYGNCEFIFGLISKSPIDDTSQRLIRKLTQGWEESL
jgi:hypothetical protein